MYFLLVYKEDYPWDVRVEKITRTLNDLGYSGGVLARNRSCRVSEECLDGILVNRLPKISSVPAFIRFLINLPLWFNPVWIWSIYSLTKRNSYKVIIVRDLPLVKAAIVVGKITGTKVIYDMAECYPLMYDSIQSVGSNGISSRLLKNSHLAALYEKECVHKVDWVWVMIEESRDRLINNLGVPPDKVSIVSNTPILREERDYSGYHNDRKVRIVYVGFLSLLRGLDLLIEGVSAFCELEDRSKISVDIIGKGKEAESLKELVRQRGVADVVTIHGWLEQDEVDRLVQSSNVGALTYRNCSHWNHTIPNKLFDYMAAGLPVLAGDIKPIARIMAECECGLVADATDKGEIARNLIKLSDPAYRNILGENGYQKYRQRYNWDREVSVIQKDLDTLLNGVQVTASN
ncbi:glycosyltransferase family 4 protein [uncultured Halovibrio sp.]|uniref:glycosyltransferase family 4 protein n=1 Tax=uncultured Halovibrio sp. TaxID=985049 RepID=UPI0025FD75E3|nr:glycosyltransferase family 4 protein [uncultured Halovibrio sp.]